MSLAGVEVRASGAPLQPCRLEEEVRELADELEQRPESLRSRLRDLAHLLELQQ